MTEHLRVEYRKVETLIPFARNPRTHSEAQVAKLAASIVEFGWTKPILVDGSQRHHCRPRSSGGRAQAGSAEVPVIELGHLTPAQKRAYVIADNRLALDAGWDEELLSLELAELSESGYDLTLTGFSNEEIEELLVDAEQVHCRTSPRLTPARMRPTRCPRRRSIRSRALAMSGNWVRTA
jgi:ParB-like chromosome segregation protein Spo0J